MDLRNQNIHVIDTTNKYNRPGFQVAMWDPTLQKLKEDATGIWCQTDLPQAELSKTFLMDPYIFIMRKSARSRRRRLPAPRTTRR